MAKSFKLKQRKKSSAGSLKFAPILRKFLIVSVPYILCLALVGFLCGGVVAYAMNSPTFQLEEVKILNIGTLTPEQSFQFSELRRGENLIQLDLVAVQQVIKRNHPEFKEVKVRRVLPNRVEVLLKRRTPVAQVLFSRYVQVDKDRVVLPGSSVTPFRNLTIVTGISTPRGGVSVGSILADETSQRVMRLLDVIKRREILKNHVLTKVEVAEGGHITLFVDDVIEIRIGNSHFTDRLKLLEITLKNLALDPAKIRYIDLRFDDVIVGPQ